MTRTLVKPTGLIVTRNSKYYQIDSWWVDHLGVSVTAHLGCSRVGCCTKAVGSGPKKIVVLSMDTRTTEHTATAQSRPNYVCLDLKPLRYT